MGKRGVDSISPESLWTQESSCDERSSISTSRSCRTRTAPIPTLFPTPRSGTSWRNCASSASRSTTMRCASSSPSTSSGGPSLSWLPGAGSTTSPMARVYGTRTSAGRELGRVGRSAGRPTAGSRKPSSCATRQAPWSHAHIAWKSGSATCSSPSSPPRTPRPRSFSFTTYTYNFLVNLITTAR